MNLYLLTQSANAGWDTYDSCIVSAECVSAAKFIRPDKCSWEDAAEGYGDWAMYPSEVTVELIGLSLVAESKVILASFNAG